MATERIEIIITENGSRVVSRNIQVIGSSAQSSMRSIDLLRSALGFLSAALAIDKIRQYADEWNRAAGAIAIATKSTYQASQVTDALFDAAQRTRSQFGELVGLYSKVARAGKELGVSQQEIIQFTEGVGKALAVQGTSTQQARGALLQLGQALGSGIVRAEEFNSVLEGAPTILQTVADNIKGVDGSIAKLRTMVINGKLSSKEFFDAFQKGAGELDAKFKQAPLTISQGFTLIENSMMRFIGELDKTLGVSNKIGEVARFISENFKAIGTAALALGAILATVFAPLIITQFASAISSLFALMAANPFIALAAGIAAAVVILSQYGDQIAANAEGTASLNDVLRATGEVAVEVFGVFVSVVESGVTALLKLGNFLDSTLDPLIADSAASWTASYKGFFDNTGSGFQGFAKSVARVVDAISGLMIGLGILIYRVFSGLPDVFNGVFKDLYATAVTGVEKIVNLHIDAANKLRDAVGLDAIPAIKIEHAEADKDYFKKYGESLAQSFDEGFSVLDGVFEKKVDSIFKRAEDFQASRKELERLNAKSTGKDNLTDPLGKAAKAPVNDKELKKVENALRQLLNTIDPISGALLEMAKAQKTLNDAERLGLITHAQHTEYLAKLNKHYADILDPMRKVKREFEEEAQLLNMNAKARETEVAVRKIRDDLIEKGRPATEAELTTLRETISAQQEYTKFIKDQDDLLAETVVKREDFARQLSAMQDLLTKPNSGFTLGDAAKKTNDLLGSMGIDTAGTQTAAEAQLAVLQEMYSQIDQLRQADLISEQTAAQLKAKAEITYQEQRLQNARGFFGDLASLSKSGNSKVAAVGKAAAIAQATIDGVLAVQKALASAPPPVNYALAAAAGVSAAANVATIAGVGFATGGEFTVGGGGGVDSQMVAFRATPGEQVRVSTPQQVKKGQENQQGQGNGDGQTSSGIRIVNVLDPSLVGDFLSSSQGEKTLVNVLQKNPQIIQNIARQG